MKKEYTREQISNAVANSTGSRQAAQLLGCSHMTVQRLAKKFGVTKQEQSEVTTAKVELLKSKLTDEQSQVRKLQKALAIKDEELSSMWNIKNSIDLRGTGSPDWMKFNSKTASAGKSIPTLFFSDEHFGEVVTPSQVNFVNEYNTDIAKKRFNNVLNNYLDVINNHLNNVDTDKMVLAVGGDSVSGDIHEELAVTNDETTMESVFTYTSCLEAAIKELLASGVKQIFCPMVRGNHNRMTHKTHTKNVLETSNAYLIYKFIQKLFAGDKRIVFSIAPGMDCFYQVNNHKMLLTHGDQFKGGNGIGGVAVPILRGFYKKQANYQATGNGFDSMAIGHFHQFTSIANGQVIINGSLKGFDEYSQRNGYSFQEPCQGMWLTHPQRGITIQLPVYAEDKKDKQFKSSEWVSWKE